MLRHWIAFLGLLSVATVSSAEITAKNLDYKHGSTTLESVLIFDNAVTGQRPGVLLVSELGSTPADVRSRAGQIAKLGYAVLCVDLYGKGVAPANSQEAITKLSLDGKDRSLVRGRITAAIDLAAKIPQIDSKRLAGVGYGVGATSLLEAVRSGADFDGIVCVHGELHRGTGETAKIGSSVLVIVHPDDSKPATAKLKSFEDEMKSAGAEWKVVRLPGSNCEFPPPKSGREPKNSKSIEVDADRKIGDAIRVFLTEEVPVAKKPAGPAVAKTPPVPKGVPDKAMKVLAHVDKHGEAMENYEGGRNFGNFEKRLPQNDEKGRRIKYREWDVNPLRPGVNRGAERLVTGSDGSAHYTDDHYKTFKKIR